MPNHQSYRLLEDRLSFPVIYGFDIWYVTYPHIGEPKYATQPPWAGLGVGATLAPKTVKWTLLGRRLT